jgi:hypothetical protein
MLRLISTERNNSQIGKVNTTMKLKPTNCTQCGAPLRIDAGATTVTCEACGSTFSISVRPRANRAQPPSSGIVRHTISRQNFLKAFAEWLSEGRYTPVDILMASSLTKATPLLVPIWRYIGEFQGNWSAKIVSFKTVPYPGHETRIVDGEQKRVPVTKTRTDKDVQPVTGAVNGGYDVFACANNELDSTTASVVEGANRTDLRVLEHTDEAVAGAVLVSRNLDDDRAWRRRAYSQVNHLVRSKVNELLHGKGDMQQNIVHQFLHTNHRVDSLYLPVWKAEYEYRRQHYSFVLDGRENSQVPGNMRPEDTEHRARAWGAIAPALLYTVLALGWFLLASEPLPLAAWAAAILAWVLGIAFRIRMSSASRATRSKSLIETLARIEAGRPPLTGQETTIAQSPRRGLLHVALLCGGPPLAAAALIWFASWITAQPEDHLAVPDATITSEPIDESLIEAVSPEPEQAVTEAAPSARREASAVPLHDAFVDDADAETHFHLLQAAEAQALARGYPSPIRDQILSQFNEAPRDPIEGAADLASLYRILRDHDKCDPMSAGYTLSATSIRIMRNTPFATEGYSFSSQDLKDIFEREPWYRANADVNATSPPTLAPDDKACVEHLRSLEQR